MVDLWSWFPLATPPVGVTKSALHGGYQREPSLIDASSERAWFGLDYRGQELVTASIFVGALVSALAYTRLFAILGQRTTIMIVAGIYGMAMLAAALTPNAWFLGSTRLSSVWSAAVLRNLC